MISTMFRVKLLRYMFARSDAKRDKGLTVPSDIKAWYEQSYGPHGKANTLDVYRSNNFSGKLPVIVNVHGGGYVYGSTKPYKFYCMNLAQKGFVVVNFNYRLAPKHQFPAPIEDVNMVMHYISKHQVEYEMDLGNVFMVGDSAGAQICSQYAALYSNPAYAKQMDLDIPKFRLAAVGLNCGMYDMKAETSHADPKQFVFHAYFSKDILQWGDKIDVLKHINSHYPPAHILSSKGDFLHKNVEPMATFLKSKGVPVESKIYGDLTTGHVFQIDIRSDVAKEATKDQLTFFRRFLAHEIYL